MSDNNKIWNNIPLADYEVHMAAQQVGQLQLLNALTRKCLRLLQPQSCIFLGIAGGNGLEHIDNNITHQVIAIDINPQYLATTWQRYSSQITSLKCIELDIAQNPETILHAGFIWAALIFEYTGIDQGLAFCKNNIAGGGSLIVTIQLNNGVTSVSNTGIETIKQAGAIFKAVDAVELIEKALNAGFVLASEEENFLPNGKSFKTMRFIYNRT